MYGFKVFLESQEITWHIENPNRWEGVFKVGISEFVVKIEFNQVTDSWERSTNQFSNSSHSIFFATQSHLKPKNIPKKSIIATIDFEDETGAHHTTGKVQSKAILVQRAMTETFDKLWQREPDFITFYTKEATKIMAYDQFIWRSSPILKHYFVLKMPKPFRDVSHLDPSKHSSQWLLQKKKSTHGQQDWFNQHKQQNTQGYEGRYEPYLPPPSETEQDPESRRHSFKYQILRMQMRQRQGKELPGDEKLNDLLQKVLAAEQRRNHPNSGDEQLLALLDDNMPFNINNYS